MTRKKAEILSGKLSAAEKISSGDLGSRDLLTRISESHCFSRRKQINAYSNLICWPLTNVLSRIAVRANLADDLPESQRLPDEELVAQITTFLFAGFETTSTALSFTLELLSTRPEIQERLRQELRAVDEDSPSLSVPFLSRR